MKSPVIHKVSQMVTLLTPLSYRSSYPKVFYKKGILKKFAKFTGKHPRQSPFFK